MRVFMKIAMSYEGSSDAGHSIKQLLNTKKVQTFNPVSLGVNPTSYEQ